jgi:sulfonate transport system permease protein
MASALEATAPLPKLQVVVGPDADARRPGPAALAWRRVWRSRWMLLCGPLALLGAWWLATGVGHVSSTTLASPPDVARTAGDLISNGQLPQAMLVSVRRVALGLLIGVSAGTIFALVSGLFQVGERLVDPLMHMLRTMPALALVPLFVLWLGIGEMPKVLLVAFGVTFPIYLNLHAGIRAVDARLIEAGRVYGLSRWGLIREVVLPGALPSWLVGLRYSLAIAWIVLVASEQINATTGIGALMNNAENLLQTNVMLVGLLVYSVLGVLSDVIVRLLERWTLSWRRGLRYL